MRASGAISWALGKLSLATCPTHPRALSRFLWPAHRAGGTGAGSMCCVCHKNWLFSNAVSNATSEPIPKGGMGMFPPGDQRWVAGSVVSQLSAAGYCLDRLPNCWSLGHDFPWVKINGTQETSPATQLIPRQTGLMWVQHSAVTVGRGAGVSQVSWGWVTPLACWRRGRSSVHAPDAFLGDGRDLCPLVLKGIFSRSMDTGKSFPLCLDSCMDSVPAEKHDFNFFFFFFFKFLLGHLSPFPVLDPFTVQPRPAGCGQEKHPQDHENAALAAEGAGSCEQMATLHHHPHS